ncbi:hypothetical protein ABZW32_24575 [Streptomyces sp. NPDC004667]|uniref:hypothetical protein n=1 Tax=Streptomyces sp. NPDC004667 TaxID=3154285 RepID=UPI0033B01CBC
MNVQEYSFTVWAHALIEAKEYLQADGWEDFREGFTAYCGDRLYDVDGFSDAAEDLWRYWSESRPFPSDALELATLVKEYAHNAAFPDPFESPAENQSSRSVEGAYQHIMQTVPGAENIPTYELLSIMLETIDTIEPTTHAQ